MEAKRGEMCTWKEDKSESGMEASSGWPKFLPSATMLCEDPFGSLPEELLALILNELDITQLLVARVVCKCWRAITSTCPAYSSNVRIAATSASALEFFQTRISAVKSQPLNLTYDLRAINRLDAQGVTRTDLAPTLAAELYRVRSLCLSIEELSYEELISVLLQPAPTLEFLKMDIITVDHPNMWQPTARTTMLPPNLFAGLPTRIKQVHLTNFILSESSMACFQHVKIVHIKLHGIATVNWTIIENLPNLEEYTFQAQKHPPTLLRPPELRPANVPKLKRLDLAFHGGGYCSPLAWLARPEDLYSVRLWCPLGRHVELLLGHLVGPLGVILLIRNFNMHLSFLTDNNRRVFHEPLYKFVAQETSANSMRAICLDLALWQRINTLRLTLLVLQTVYPLPPLDQCVELQVQIQVNAAGRAAGVDHRATPTDAINCLALPALQLVYLDASGIAITDPPSGSDIARFLEKLIPETIPPRTSWVEIAVAGLEFVGCIDTPSGSFARRFRFQPGVQSVRLTRHLRS